MRPLYDLDRIKSEWTIESLLQSMAIDLGRHKKSRCPLPECADVDPKKAASFSYQLDTWYCHRCRQGGDVVRLVMLLRGDGFREACAFLAGDLDEAPERSVSERRRARAKMSYLQRAIAHYQFYRDLEECDFQEELRILRIQRKNRELDEIDCVLKEERIREDGLRSLEHLLTLEHWVLFDIRHGRALPA